MKKIVLFSDGTGNSAANPNKTNVWRLYKALDLTPGSGQVAYYDQGVGTSPFMPLALLGLAFGFGLARNVRYIYGFLCRSYEKGDQIYVFGFSRGAFTIRVVAALIASQGIIDPSAAKDDRDLNRLIVRAYRTWRQKSFTPSLLSFFFRPLRDWIFALLDKFRSLPAYNPERNLGYDRSESPSPLIDFIGVWDTVDAYGMPIDELTRAWDMVVWPLMPKDRDLSPRIKRARHALALDERRESFEPMLWNEASKDDNASRLQQVWFPGMHADVGGGYPDDALAYSTLNWMLDESAKNNGLDYIPAERAAIKNYIAPLGPLHNSRNGFGNFYRYAPRDIESLCNSKKPGLLNSLKAFFKRPDAEKNEVSIKKPKFHHSVFERIAHGGDGYAPINLPADYAVVDAGGAVIDIANPLPTQIPPESAEQAKARRGRQIAIWSKVWWRQIVYFATLAAILFFIVYPQSPLFQSLGKIFDENITVLLGGFRNLFATIPSLLNFIPGAGIAEDWIAQYQSQPFIFLLLLGVIGALLWSSHWLKAKLISEMRGYLIHIVQPGPHQVAVPCGGFARFLDSSLYKDRLAKYLRMLLEAAAVFFLLFLMAAAISHLWFAYQEGSGAVCEKTAPDRALESKLTLPFNPKNPCFDTGINVKRGQRLTIVFKVPEGWHDDSIPADAEGWVNTPPYMYAFLPLRRHLFTDWYQPVARIGRKLFDRYPLVENCTPDREEGKPAGVEAPTRKICMKIKPRRSGRLFLYLNDAVLFSPDFYWEFYRNNNCDKDCPSCPDDVAARTACCNAEVTITPATNKQKAKKQRKN